MSGLKLAILGSTRGTNLLPLHQALKSGQLKAELSVVISNKADAGILDQARLLHIPAHTVLAVAGETRAHFDARLIDVLEPYCVNLIVLMGYMRILSPAFIAYYQDKIINVHPSLLPQHAGLMDLAVHAAVLQTQAAETGCSVHLVDEGVDTGRVLVQKRCAVLAGDCAQDLKQRVQALEVEALIEAINDFNKRT